MLPGYVIDALYGINLNSSFVATTLRQNQNRQFKKSSFDKQIVQCKIACGPHRSINSHLVVRTCTGKTEKNNKQIESHYKNFAMLCIQYSILCSHYSTSL